MKPTGLFWWIDRWRKSSAYMDMTVEQQGAYRNLLDEAHLRGGPLPNDERILAKACGDALIWDRVRVAVMARFDLRDDGWHNDTLDEVYRRTMQLSAARSKAGISGNRKRWPKTLASAIASPIANASSPSPSPSPSPDQSPSPNTIPVSLQQAKRKIRTAPLAPISMTSPVENIKIITKLAHEVLRGLNGHAYLGADVVEDIKTLCAKRKIAYDAEVVRKALDSAEVQRKAAR
jgi:uncharacterized protein YdaU (DUF1376 family)